MQNNQQKHDPQRIPKHTNKEGDVCCICLGALPKVGDGFVDGCGIKHDGFVTLICCGKRMHAGCSEDFTDAGESSLLKQIRDSLKSSNPPTTLEGLQDSLQAGNLNRCPMCRHSIPEPGSKEFMQLIKKWVKKKKAWAQSMLADHYRLGDCVPQSWIMAAKLYEAAALQGDIDAQCHLGFMYAKGDGVEKSFAKARELLAEAATKYKLVNAIGCLEWMKNTEMIERAKSSSPGQLDALNFCKIQALKDFASKGNPDAQYALGNFYALGEGVEQSWSKARVLITKAVAQGHKQAIISLEMLDRHAPVHRYPVLVDPDNSNNTVLCDKCNKPARKNETLYKCCCRTANYCDSTCQTGDWQRHKKMHRDIVKMKGYSNTEGERKDEVPDLNNNNNKKETTEEENEEAPGKDDNTNKDKDATDETIKTTADGTNTIKKDAETEETNACPICQEVLPKDGCKFNRMLCCGKGMHDRCRDKMINSKSLSLQQMNTCVLCRTLIDDDQHLAQILLWVDKGKAWAQEMLGNKYRDGDEVPRDYHQASRYYQLGADQGHGASMRKLGIYYYKNQQKDLANEWLVKAAELGDNSAIANLKLLDQAARKSSSSFIPKPTNCSYCGISKTNPSKAVVLNACKACHCVFYCSKICQKKDWKCLRDGHKEWCKSFNNGGQ